MPKWDDKLIAAERWRRRKFRIGDLVRHLERKLCYVVTPCVRDPKETETTLTLPNGEVVTDYDGDPVMEVMYRCMIRREDEPDSPGEECWESDLEISNPYLRQYDANVQDAVEDFFEQSARKRKVF